MIQLSWWEQIVISMALSFLTAWAAKVTNPVEQAGIQSTITFLQKLLGGGVSIT